MRRGNTNRPPLREFFGRLSRLPQARTFGGPSIVVVFVRETDGQRYCPIDVKEIKEDGSIFYTYSDSPPNGCLPNQDSYLQGTSVSTWACDHRSIVSIHQEEVVRGRRRVIIEVDEH